MIGISIAKLYGFAKASVIVELLDSAGLALLSFLPIFVYDLLSRWIKGFKLTFILPLLFMEIEFFAGLSGISALDSFAATQVYNIVLIQTASLVGSYGITFIVVWFSSVVMYVIENWNDKEKIKKPIIAYVFFVCLLDGLWRS